MRDRSGCVEQHSMDDIISSLKPLDMISVGDDSTIKIQPIYRGAIIIAIGKNTPLNASIIMRDVDLLMHDVRGHLVVRSVSIFTCDVITIHVHGDDVEG